MGLTVLGILAAACGGKTGESGALRGTTAVHGASDTAAVNISKPINKGAAGATADAEVRVPSVGAQAEITIVGRQASPRLRVEIAETDAERTRGLMFRRELAANTGMIFLMPRDDDWSFWMRNTWIPLDMIFIDRDWTVVGVLVNVPPLNDESRRVGKVSRYILELGAHESVRHGIVAGTRLGLSR